ncbi:MAG: hypothetical protein IJG80_02650 [Selenomonadaceae bacterium]|nr:hypothetical protein [Selenomonadaceae bacterium]MBQ3433669.1 hypothetical protein [Selenomonadaceae bacterium]
MKIELNEEQQRIAEKVFEQLVGQTIHSAKEIIKSVLVTLHERAVIRGDSDE